MVEGARQRVADGMRMLNAVARGRLAEVQEALADGADLDFSNVYGETAPMIAARTGHSEILRFLLGAGAKDARDAGHWKATHHAASEGRTECLELLLEAGWDFHTGTLRGRTPLGIAVLEGHLACAGLLLRQGASPEEPLQDLEEPLLLWAVTENKIDLAQLLLDFGADPERVCGEDSPLRAAGRKGFREMAEMLLAAGADPSRRDSRGRTAADLALANGFADLAAAIEFCSKSKLEKKSLEKDVPSAGGAKGTRRL